MKTFVFEKYKIINDFYLLQVTVHDVYPYGIKGHQQKLHT